MNLITKEFELDADETVKKGTKYTQFIDIETGKKYRPKDGLMVVGASDGFEPIAPVTHHNTLNHGTPKIPEFDTVTHTTGYAHTEDITEPDYTVTWSEVSEMDKETFVILVEAIEQNQSAMMDVKQLVYNVDGHTCVYDHLTDTMIKYLDEEMETDLVSLYFFELDLEVSSVEALYDLIIQSRECNCD